MKFRSPKPLKEITQLLKGKYLGKPDLIVSGINEIHRVEEGDITFVDHPKYYAKALNSKASVILINSEDIQYPDNKALIISDNPFREYNKLVSHFFPFKSSRSFISDSALIGENTIIQAGVFVGNNVQIGKNCIIHSNVSIYDNTLIGNNVIIHSNTVIGSDAFYFKKGERGYEKMLSCGSVIIEDNVEIGACCTIDRGVSATTMIGQGSKLDNQVHIGHDTIIGKNCLFAAQVGVAGVVTIEDNVTLWGQVGVQKDLTIGARAIVLGQSGVSKSLEKDKTYFGSPAREAIEKMREIAAVKKLPRILESVR